MKVFIAMKVTMSGHYYINFCQSVDFIILFLLDGALCFNLVCMLSCPIPSDPLDCSLLGSSVHEILWARIVEWVAISWLQRIFLT